MDRANEFSSIREINYEIRRLNLAAYAPLRYVLPHKQAANDAKYSTEIRGGEGELDLLIATDCFSEGQNLQDCDWLINHDIRWNRVRIIQRIERIGSPNSRIQLVNFWPNMELEEYINFESKSG